MASEKQYIDLFHSVRALLEAHSCAALNARRDEALRLLEQYGLPTAKTERYKYINVQEAFAPDYGLNLKRLPLVENPYKSFHCNVPNLSTRLFYVVNDVVVLPETAEAESIEGLKVMTLCEAEKKMPGFIEQFYHKAAGREYDGVTSLNTLLAQDGILVYLPAGLKLEHTLQIVSVASAGMDMMANRRILVVAEEDVEASLLFCDHAEGRQRYLTTQVIEVFADCNAKVALYGVEETQENCTRFCNLYVEQQAGSKVSYNGITLHTGMSCTRADMRLLGEEAHAEAAGAVIADGRELVDNNILIHHAAPACTSDMLYKYVLDGKSVGAWAGKVLVSQGAQKTLSEQINANLCASSEARAYSQPMLEIYADDVKCNHGSTIGKLDDAALFYMRQRGIEEREARLLLQHAFVNDVLQRVEIEQLRDRLSYLVDLRFRGQLSRCKGCKMCKLPEVK
ncbi:MAG: Fe-S cluster assembly protein SufD [Bacteroidaceae bacterium]|nr:Fe-S cluster assembly protein SufD [Bacteroidaceae bacterium]